VERPDETACVVGWDPGWEIVQRKASDEKIILVSREPGNHEHMIALIEAVFPECTVEIIPGAVGDIDRMSAPCEKDMGSYGGRFTAQGD